MLVDKPNTAIEPDPSVQPASSEATPKSNLPSISDHAPQLIEKLPTEILQEIFKLPGTLWLPYASPTLYGSLDTFSSRKQILDAIFRVEKVMSHDDIARAEKNREFLTRTRAKSAALAQTLQLNETLQQILEDDIKECIHEMEYMELFYQAVQLPWFNKTCFDPGPGNPALIELETILEWTLKEHGFNAMFAQPGRWTQALGDFICAVIGRLEDSDRSFLMNMGSEILLQASIRSLREGCQPMIWILTGVEMDGLWDVSDTKAAEQEQDQGAAGIRSLSFLRGRRDWDTVNATKLKAEGKWVDKIFMTDIVARVQMYKELVSGWVLWEEFITKYRELLTPAQISHYMSRNADVLMWKQ